MPAPNPIPTNRPKRERLLRSLKGTDSLADADPALLDELLDASIAWVEDKASTTLDPEKVTELRDGNGSNQITVFRWPLTSVQKVEVKLPVLALNRVYLPDEIKVYREQSIVQVFTYKLAAEHVSLHLDQQVYGNLFPSLPQCVTIEYTSGFPLYDKTSNQGSLDGQTWVPGNPQTSREKIWLTQLQQAAVCDAAASYLAQTARLHAGVIASVSFDGYSQSTDTQAYGAAVTSLIERRDELIAGRKRRFMLATGGR